jgi:hypothetical protein
VKSNIAILHNPNLDEWIWDEPPVRAMYVPIYSNEGRWFLQAFSRYTDSPAEVYLDETEREPPPRVSCLAITVSNDTKPRLEGLVLDASILGEHKFRRIGYFSVEGTDICEAFQRQGGWRYPNK